MSARATLALAAVAAVATACAGPLLANEVPTATPRATPAPTVAAAVDPVALSFPGDDAPHDRLTEWWYFTGHLADATGRPFGFELVVFRAERGRFPVAWASHLAVTDEVGGRFLYDQRSEVGPQVDRSSPGAGFDLAIAGDVVPGVRGPATPWRMTGSEGRHRLDAPGGRTVDGTTFGLSLELDDRDLDPWLHGGVGWIDFGPAGGSYYYSRPRMRATGRLDLAGATLDVTGTAWFDHQWGDFISVGGGWDWFAVNLDDGTDLTVSVVRDPFGAEAPAYGSIRDAGGDRPLPPGSVTVRRTGATWTSSRTGITWPAGWRIEVPSEGLSVTMRPTVADQELDTASTTGVVYWEGSQDVAATRAGQAIGGDGYVELTGYAPDEGTG